MAQPAELMIHPKSQEGCNDTMLPPSTHEILENSNNFLLNSIHPLKKIPYLTRSLHPTTQSSAETHQPAAMLQTTSCRPLTTLLDSSQVSQEYIL
ncbi:hypothetical protein N7501_002764 [Penicillium viridicatum]|nr:hypothetical protein N7501_002764 [Penicillium viridicatum]